MVSWFDSMTEQRLKKIAILLSDTELKGLPRIKDKRAVQS